METHGLQKDVEDTDDAFARNSKRGGWTTLPFILGNVLTLTIAAGGLVGNLIVYLITEYNVKSIDATQVNNVVLGCLSLSPIAGAIISDSFYGSFPVIVFFSFLSLMGVTLMALTASFHSLRPSPCTDISLICESPTKFQYGVLYTALGLASIGFGSTRFTTVSMGAGQFEDLDDRAIYFNWYFCFLYVGYMLSSTVMVYIQDNVSWTLGFGICVASNAIGAILFLSGKKFYRHTKPTESPFTSITRVVIAAVRKRKLSSRNQEYNYDINETSTTCPSHSFRFLNRAAMKIQSDGPKSRSWSLCTVQEVEDLKTLIRIMPLWSTGIMLSILVGMLGNFTILQALTMDRHLGGSNFKIPAASFLFFVTLGAGISLVILDRLIFPIWKNLTGRSLTTLQRIGLGHVLNVFALVSCALIEVQRLHVFKTRGTITTIVPLSALWLVMPLTILGTSEAFQFPGQVSLYYQEFPTSLRNTSSAMLSLSIASGFYLSTVITSLIRENTGWLKDDINDGRLDIVYWMLAGLGVVNTGYFLICAKMFRHKLDKIDHRLDNVSSS